MAGARHDRWQDAPSAYVLGVLDANRRAAFEDHLAGCRACREAVDRLLPAGDLPAADDPGPPPPALKARIMAEVERGEAERTVVARVAAPGASVRLELEGDHGRLVARGLPAPPSGRVYQVWLARGRGPAAATGSLFVPGRDGAATASLPGSLAGVDEVMVTDEPDGGSPRPTGEVLAVADLSR